MVNKLSARSICVIRLHYIVFSQLYLLSLLDFLALFNDDLFLLHVGALLIIVIIGCAVIDISLVIFLGRLWNDYWLRTRVSVLIRLFSLVITAFLHW